MDLDKAYTRQQVLQAPNVNSLEGNAYQYHSKAGKARTNKKRNNRKSQNNKKSGGKKNNKKRSTHRRSRRV